MAIDPEITKHAPGLLGSLVAVFLIKDTWSRRLVLLIAGVAAAAYGAPHVSLRSGADAELAGFLTGLFSMAVAAKLIEVIDAVKPSDLIDRILKRIGL